MVQDTIDWGRVVPEALPGETAKISKEIRLKNVGSKMLKISEVRPSCGCTSAPLDKDSLAPGESTTMRITLNLPLSNGTITKHITVRSNDFKDPVKSLTLRANIQRPVQLSSSYIPFNKGEIGKPVLGVVTLSQFTNKSVEVRVKSTDKKVKVLTPYLKIPKGGSGEIRVEVTSQKEGAFTAEIVITTSVPGYEKFELKGYGSVDAK